MMRIAIAGTNGFAQYLCHYIREQTPHQFVLLSRRSNAGLAAKGWQVLPTNYDSPDDLAFLLMGIDILISTVAGSAQLNLIDAAVVAGVRHFVPSEFGCMPSWREKDDPTDNSRSAAIVKLEGLRLQSRLSYTVFVCGIFYERFAPGGLAASQIDTHHSLGQEGDFLANVRKRCATLPAREDVQLTQDMQDRYICMTSSRDAARFVVAALQLQSWPTELRFRAERVTLQSVVDICEKVGGGPFTIESLPRSSLRNVISYARASGNKTAEVCASQHLYAADGRYDVVDTNLDRFVKVECEKFEDWLRDAWRPVLRGADSSSRRA